MNNTFYDGTKLLSLKDINGKDPEVLICVSNRTAGKTTYFNKWCVNRFLKDPSEQFGLIYRYTYELDDIPEKFFTTIGQLYFPQLEFSCKKRAKGVFAELFIDGVTCGYAFALNQAENTKRYSQVFCNVKRLLMDEFQSETNNYCPEEMRKFQSLHTSIARGNGEMVRFVPTVLIGNPVSMLNPYYNALNIGDRLQENTKFLKGDGWVMEQGHNEIAAQAQMESGFNRAFSKGSNYLAYSAQGVYLKDNKAFIETSKSWGRCRYVCTIKYNNESYAIKEYSDKGIIYVDDVIDNTFSRKLALTTDDHNINYVMLHTQSVLIFTLRQYFDRGCFRFKNYKCKNVIMKMLSYE